MPIVIAVLGPSPKKDALVRKWLDHSSYTKMRNRINEIQKYCAHVTTNKGTKRITILECYSADERIIKHCLVGATGVVICGVTDQSDTTYSSLVKEKKIPVFHFPSMNVKNYLMPLNNLMRLIQGDYSLKVIDIKSSC